MISNELKTKLINSAIVMGIVIFLFSMLWTVGYFSKPFRTEGLRQSITAVLEQQYPGMYTVTNAVPIHNSAAMTVAIYHVQSLPNARKQYDYAMIARVATICGPKPAIFLYHESQKRAEFVSFAFADKKTENLFAVTAENTQVRYWENRLAYLLKIIQKGS